MSKLRTPFKPGISRRNEKRGSVWGDEPILPTIFSSPPQIRYLPSTSEIVGEKARWLIYIKCQPSFAIFTKRFTALIKGLLR